MKRPDDSAAEIRELKARLTEAEQTLDAIRSGQVDALAVSGPEGDRIFTLQGAETPYRILVEQMDQGALMLVDDGTILYSNSRFSEMAKTPLEQVIGSSWQQFFPVETHPQLEASLKTAGLPGPGTDLNLRAGDDTVCPVHLSLRSMSASGVEGFAVIVRDLTERRRSENALRKTSEELIEKNQELETFSYSISHDMRQPLRAMQGYAQILLEDCGEKLDPLSRSYLQRIITSADRLDRLIHDVLGYCQLSRTQNETVTIDLDEMVRDMVAKHPGLHDANIELIRAPAKVRGNAVGLGQCISNLLGNAVKFVPPGSSPSVKVWTERANGRLRLWVADQGIGISPKDQENIFGIFCRVNSAEEYEGTGIGLTMVKKAVEKMGGRVGVVSELGAGSRFWIELESA